jgi:predicted small lipoprotein YifL
VRRGRRGAIALRLGVGLTLLVGLAACGKKGPPLPPLRPVPARVLDLAAQRSDARVELRFTVPATNSDGTTPPAVERVEIYRLAGTANPTAATPPGADPSGGAAVSGAAAGRGRASNTEAAQTPAPRPPAAPPRTTGAAIAQPANLIGTLDVTRPPPEGAPPAPAGAGEALRPGDAATFVDQIPASELAAAPGAVWRYVVVGVAGRDRRGPPSGIAEVALTAAPAAPAGLALGYDATTLRLTWQGGVPGARYRVMETPTEAAAGDPVALTPDPIEAAEFSLPVEFGRPRCFAVRSVSVAGTTTVEGLMTPPVCETPVDTFPPSAPGALIAFQEGAQVVLRWQGVETVDLAGYLVLRGGAAGETLQPLTTAPVTGTVYRDASVQAGATYTYAVVAIDRAASPNTSAQSNRETVTVR